MTDIYCPTCELDFEGEVWDNGKCPTCGRKYYWDEMVNEDYSDCWPIVEWENK